MKRWASRFIRRRFLACWGCWKMRTARWRSGFRNEGDLILLLDANQKAFRRAASLETEFSSSEYAKTIHGIVAGTPPAIDLAAEKRLIDCLVNLASEQRYLFGARRERRRHRRHAGGILFYERGLVGGISLAMDDAQLTANKEAAASETSCRLNLRFSAKGGARAVVSSFPGIACPQSVKLQHNMAFSPEQIGTVTRGEFRIQYNGGNGDRRNCGFVPASRGAGRWLRPSRVHDSQNSHPRRRPLPRSVRRVRDFWPPRSVQAHLSGTCMRCSIAGRKSAGIASSDGADIHFHKSLGSGAGNFHAGRCSRACRERWPSAIRAIRRRATTPWSTRSRW